VLQKLDLLGRQLQRLLALLLFQLEPAVMAGAHVVVVEDTPHGRSADTHTFQRQAVAQSVTTPARVLQGQRDKPSLNVRCGGGRVRVMDRRQVAQPCRAIGLKAPLKFVGPGARHAPLSASLRYVAQHLRQLQDTQPLTDDSLFCINAHGSSQTCGLTFYHKSVRNDSLEYMLCRANAFGIDIEYNGAPTEFVKEEPHGIETDRCHHGIFLRSRGPAG
jgi:hypothetical protein